MKLIWQLVRKDLVRFRLILLAWVLLLAGKYLFLAAVAGVFGHPSLYWISVFEFPMPLFLVSLAGPPLLAFFLVAALVFEDPPAGCDPFWVTRPISGAQLLSAKLILAVLMFVVAPLLAAVPWWLACGFGVNEIAPLAGLTGSAYLLIVLVGLAMASVTNGYPRYFVWTLAGLAVVLGAHIVPLVFGGLFVVDRFRGNMPPAFYLWVWAVCIAILSIAIAWHRFVARHFGRGLPLIVGLILAVSVALFVSPPGPLRRLFVPQTTVFPGDENVRVSVAGDVRTFNAGGLSVPLRIDGLSENSVPVVFLDAKWKSVDGKVWPTRGGSWGSHYPIQRIARIVLHLPAAASASDIIPINFTVAARHAKRIATEAATIEGRARIDIAQLLAVAEVPVGNTTRRFEGGSFTVSEFEQREGVVAFLLTGRVATAMDRFEGIGYIALVNRRTGEVIEPSLQTLRAGRPPVINDVVVFSTWLSFNIPNAAWIHEASFVILALGPRREIIRDVPAFTRPPSQAAPLLPERVSVAPETLQQYVGTYQPRPGASVAITELNGNLVLKPTRGWVGPKVILTPRSDTQFRAPFATWMIVSDGYELEFQRDARGRVTHFVVHEGGHDFVVPRMPGSK